MQHQLCLCSLLLASPVTAQQQLYACNWAGDLVEVVDYETSATLRWVPRDPNLFMWEVRDIAVRATTGTLFIHTTGFIGADMHEVNPITGELLGGTGCFSANTCFSLDSDLRGHLYAEGPTWTSMRILDTGPLSYCLDHPGPFTAANDGDLAIDRDGFLLCTRRGTNELVRVDPTTGATTSLGDPGVEFRGLEIDTNRMLYGITADGRLFQVDRTTLFLTPVLTLPTLHAGASGEWSGLAFRFPAGRLESEVLCSALLNSTGAPATLWPQENPAPAPWSIDFHVESMPPHSLVLLLVGRLPGSVVVGAGQLCLGSGVQRVYPAGVSNSNGRAILHLDLATVPLFGPVQSGDRLYFQAWFRDTTSSSQATVNFSDALRIDFL
jgi:hypothetical protein